MPYQQHSLAKDAKHASVCVTGAAGFIGKHLLRYLSERSMTSLALYRAHLPEPLAHCMPVFADLMRPEQILPVLERSDTVVHLAWNQSFRSRWEDVFWGTEANESKTSRNLEMLQNLLNAMQEQKCRRLIFVSALGSSRKVDSIFLQEKYEAERMVLNADLPEKIIVRTSLNFADYSYRDRFVKAVESLMQLPWFYPVPQAKLKVAPIHVLDVCATIAKLIQIQLPEPAQIIEITGKEELSVDEMFRLVSLGLGKGKHIPLRGIIGDALAPLLEKFTKRNQEREANIRDLLTLSSSKDGANQLDQSLQEVLVLGQHRFQDAMKSHEQGLLQ